MSRGNTQWWLVGFLALTSCRLLVGVLESCPANNGDRRPNIVLIFTDDQSYGSILPNGNTQTKTPHMNALARQGTVFHRHYDSTAICMASRASVMTGMYEYKTGCNFLHGPMHRATFQQSFPVLLRRAGYRTAFAGKFGFAVHDGSDASDGSYDRLPVKEFDEWAGGVGQTSYVTAKNRYLARYADRYPHSTRAYGAFAQDFIRNSVQAGRPFCLLLFFKAPHRPFTPDPFFDSVYKGATFDKPQNYGRAAADHLSKQSRLGRQYLSFFHDMGFDPAHYQETMRKYHQLIHGVDYAIGMMQEELQRQGVADNTVILFTSDNGFFCGSHGMGGKVLPYEEGSKVPLVIVDPRVEESARVTEASCVTGTVDIAPTILELAGVEVPPQMDGRSLLPVVRGERKHVREALPLIQVWGAPPTFSMSVVTEDLKYIYWCYGDNMEPAEELFDLREDPLEMTNVIANPKYASALAQMRNHYQRQLDHWKQNAVSYNHYREFGTILDPAVPWKDKHDLVPKHMWKQYTSLAKKLGFDGEKVFDYDAVLQAARARE